MKFDWRVSAFPAGGAFVLSFLVGVISGVSFGAILLRALLAALFFGAGAAGLVMLIDRFLPELSEALKSSAPAAPHEGGTIDIVVDEDLMGEDGPIGVGSGPAVGADAVGTLAPSGDEDAQSMSDAEPSDLAPIEGEALDGDQPGAESPGASGAEIEAGGNAPDEPADVEPLDDADDDGVEVLEEVAPEAASAGSLPDIEGFSDSFSDAPADVGNGEAESEGSGEDTETMARAIRTVLKREE